MTQYDNSIIYTATINPSAIDNASVAGYLNNNYTISYPNGSTGQIEISELEELRDDSRLLYALIDAGVEDWPGYQEALANYLEDKRESI